MGNSSAESDSSRDFFRPGAFATLAGSTTAVVLLTNTLTGVVGGTPEWMPLIFAMACSVAAYSYAARSRSAAILRTPRGLRYGLVVLNGCLIYTTAFGVQGVVVSETVIDAEASAPSAATPASYTLTGWESVFSPETGRSIRVVKDRSTIKDI